MDKNIKISLDRNMKSIEHSQFLHQRSFKQATEKLDYTFPFPNRRQIEKAVLEYIALGNVTLAEQFIRTSSKDGLLTIDVGNLSENELMQARFTIVSAITLFCRTAIDNGLPETLAYSISDVYIQYLSNINNIEKIYHLFWQAFLEYFCHQSAKHQWCVCGSGLYRAGCAILGSVCTRGDFRSDSWGER